MKLFRIAQTVPSDRVPRSSTPCVYVRRSVADSSTGGKEYMYAVYQFPDGWFGVIGWHGSVRASSLASQWKGIFPNMVSAVRWAERLHRDRVAGNKGYESQSMNTDYYRSRITGSFANTDTGTQSSTASTPQQKTPTPAQQSQTTTTTTLPPQNKSFTLTDQEKNDPFWQYTD